MADEDKKLTVADLMARRNKDTPEGERPRRRRSLEDGGVSVAELTGSFPRVEGPAEQEAVSRPADKPVAQPDEGGESQETADFPGVALLVLASVVLGALVFLGFSYLWTHLNGVVVGILALVVTAGVVAAVRSMRGVKDNATLVLAAVTGVAMTFGPAVWAALT